MNDRNTQMVGANALRSRNHNRQMVLGHIRQSGQMGRAEIARLSGLSTQAVSNIISDLQGEGWLKECGRRSVGRGQPPIQYRIDPEGGYALGIEVRPDAVFAALLDLEGREVFSDRAALASSNPASVRAQVLTLCETAWAAPRVTRDKVLGAGVVLPGPFGTGASARAGSELQDWQGIEPTEWFSDLLDLPVEVENDANAAAISEGLTGVATGLDTYAFIYFGAGLGLGLISEGQRLSGGYGNAGEVGRIPVQTAQGPLALEQAVSRLSVQRHLVKAGLKVGGIEDIDAIFQARHPALMAWLDRAASPLSQAVAMIENLFDPQTIVLGGAMPDPVLDHLIGQVTFHPDSVADRPRRARPRPRLMRGGSGRMTATLGGAALVLKQAFTPRMTVVHS
ncbi:MAG: ROK family protein [Rhodobacteraceae bacterium]|nr:ROK family protein [Paracoccaceae bacterium]